MPSRTLQPGPPGAVPNDSEIGVAKVHRLVRLLSPHAGEVALRVLVEGIMDAEVSSRIGAEYGERSPERVTQRNGYRSRAWDTRVGTMDLHIPKLREGSYFPSLLEPRRRSERALLAVIQQAYVEGVSTRRVDDLVKALGCEGISKSQVSRICQELDVVVDGFMGRPLGGGPYPYLWQAGDHRDGRGYE